MGAPGCARQVTAFYDQHGSQSSATERRLQPPSGKDVHCDFKLPASFSFDPAVDASLGDATSTILSGAFSGSSTSDSISPYYSRLAGTAFDTSWSSASSSPVADICDFDRRWEQLARANATLVCTSTDSSASPLPAAPDHLRVCPQQSATSPSTVASRGTADYAGYRPGIIYEGSAKRQGIKSGAAMQRCAVPAATSPAEELSPTVQQLLLALPLEQQRLFSQALIMSGTPQQLLSAGLAISADGAAAATASSHSTTHMHGSTACTTTGLMTADAFITSVYGQPLQQQLQAALAAQQQVLAVGRHAAESAGLSPAGHSLLQLLAAEQQALTHHSVTPAAQLTCPHSLDPLSQSLPAGGCSLAQYNQAVSSSPAAAAAHLWPFPAGLSAPAAAPSAMAAAAAVLQRQQQQEQMASLMQAAMWSPAAAAAAGPPYNQSTASLLSSQVAAAAAAAAAAAYSGVLRSMPNSAAVSAPRARAHAWTPGTSSQQYLSKPGAACSAAGGSGKTSPLRKGCRSHFGGRRSSGSSSLLQQNCDAATRQQLSRSGALDSTPSEAAAGIVSQALSAAAFEEYWGVDELARGSVANQEASNSGVYGGSSSSSGDGVADCCRRSSVAGVVPPPAVRRPSSTDSEVFTMDLGPSSRDVPAYERSSSLSPADQAAGDAVKGSRDQFPEAAAAVSKSASIPPGRDSAKLNRDSQFACTTAGCRVWYPGGEARTGDDAWYLPLPPTCRLFVGNIGCWVDEALLLSYFGKYGKVMDVQVMWNTKMLARGRRVNREFAFISYSTPLEAARAVHWLDGCRLVDVEKDKNGITVEYENGESDASPAAAHTVSSAKLFKA